MNKIYNTIVIGLGAVGGAALYQLARRGDKVLGIDQFSPPHTFGSSHGETRITRQAIGEGVQYTPLALRSYEIFREMEHATGSELLKVTGGLMLSSPGSGGIHNVADFFDNMLLAANQYDIKHDLLTAADIRRRFPQFTVADNEKAYYEYQSGLLYADRCVDAQLKLAEARGADVHRNEKVLSFNQQNGKVNVRTDAGQYEAEQVVLSLGPWLPHLVQSKLASLFEVHRQVQYWFDVQNCYEQFEPGTFPIFIWELEGGRSMYGFPAVDGPGGGFKIGSASYNRTVTTETIDRDVTELEMTTTFEKQIKPFFPAAVGQCIKAKVCLYTNTEDSAFVIDRAADLPSVLLCSPCSGHGFKHSAAVGESISQIVLDGQSKLDLSSFKLGRLLAEK